MKIMITGAGGLIGASFVRAILSSRGADCSNSEDEVFALGRNVPRLKTLLGERPKCFKYDACMRFDFAPVVDVIVHAASPASPDLFVQNPVETMMTNIFGLKELLEYARRVKAKKVVYVSSSEVYGKAASRKDGFREDDYQYLWV